MSTIFKSWRHATRGAILLYYLREESLTIDIRSQSLSHRFWFDPLVIYTRARARTRYIHVYVISHIYAGRNDHLFCIWFLTLKWVTKTMSRPELKYRCDFIFRKQTLEHNEILTRVISFEKSFSRIYKQHLLTYTYRILIERLTL